MQHVKLARDRRKRKSRIKAAIFFAALLLILTGIFLAFKDTADYDPSLQSNLEPEMVDNVQYQSLTPEKTESDKQQTQAGEHPETKQNANTEDATSYDDDLQAKDDEVDEIKPQFDELTDLPKDAQDKIPNIAKKIFKAIDGFGLSRVDFFVTEDGEIVFNEINTMPGFTAISMYPMLWEAAGINKKELISELINLAFER